MVAILLVLALVALVVGLAFLTPATTGVGIIGAACWLAVLARIAQARRRL